MHITKIGYNLEPGGGVCAEVGFFRDLFRRISGMHCMEIVGEEEEAQLPNLL